MGANASIEIAPPRKNSKIKELVNDAARGRKNSRLREGMHSTEMTTTTSTTDDNGRSEEGK